MDFLLCCKTFISLFMDILISYNSSLDNNSHGIILSLSLASSAEVSLLYPPQCIFPENLNFTIDQ